MTSAPPSFAPGTALADLLPDFAGQDFLDEQPTTVAQLIGDGDSFAIGRLLSDLDLDADQLQFASRSESGMSFLAFRADGLSGEALANAWVAAAMEVLPRPSLTEVEIDDSLVLQRVRVEKDHVAGTLTVLPLRDAIVIGIVEPDRHDLVERALWSILHPGPERFLPAKLDARPLQIVAMPGEAWPNSGDVCSFLCPGELQEMAAAVGLKPSDVRLGYGQLEGSPAIVVLAFEFPGVASNDLLDLREVLAADPRHWRGTEQTVADKQVRRYQYLFGDEPVQEQWVYATDGVLFVVYVDPREVDRNRPLLEEAFAALP
ncbi:MAG TPA: hypothetical protein VFU17_07030 [Candidatus Limnocylindrales bacterium]|nr:hypothetical protein [Candidatus Limnocylindrales bacterium]